MARSQPPKSQMHGDVGGFDRRRLKPPGRRHRPPPRCASSGRCGWTVAPRAPPPGITMPRTSVSTDTSCQRFPRLRRACLVTGSPGPMPATARTIPNRVGRKRFASTRRSANPPAPRRQGHRQGCHRPVTTWHGPGRERPVDRTEGAGAAVLVELRHHRGQLPARFALAERQGGNDTQPPGQSGQTGVAASGSLFPAAADSRPPGRLSTPA